MMLGGARRSSASRCATASLGRSKGERSSGGQWIGAERHAANPRREAHLCRNGHALIEAGLTVDGLERADRIIRAFG